MPILGIQRGTKSSGLGAYDYGISERLGALGTALFGAPNPAVVQGGAAFYQPQQPQVLGTQTQTQVPTTSNQPYGPAVPSNMNKSSGGQPQSQPQQQSQSGQYSNVQGQLQGGLSNVDSDYQNYISTLDTQQGNIQRSAENATGAIDVNAQGARTALTNEAAKAAASYDQQSQQANKQATSATQQARDLYRQLQQQNIAQLSGTGLSSSSVAEALAENLGRDTARRIAGVTGSRDEVLQNISKERTNTENYVNERLSNLESQVTQQKADIQTQLLNEISKINNARNVAANDRASRRQELILNAQNAVNTLTSQAQQFAQDLEQWKAQNNAKLQNTAVSFDDLTKAMQAASSLQTQQLGTQGQVDPYAGAYQINPVQKQQEDLLNQFLPTSLIGGGYQ